MLLFVNCENGRPLHNAQPLQAVEHWTPNLLLALCD